MRYLRKLFWIFIAFISGNFGIVEKGKVYRSAQRFRLFPVWLFLGLRTVINLSHKPDTDLHDRFEEWYCRVLGIRYIRFPTIGPGYFFWEAFRDLADCEKPVLVHCEGGKDRTGGLIAFYEYKRGKSYTEIFEDWMVHWIPGEDWLQFLMEEFGK